MFNLNLKVAYLTNKDGVLYIKQNGNIENRIDNVQIRIDRDLHKLDFQYDALNYVRNTTIQKYYSYEGWESRYKTEDVLPNFYQEFEYKVCEPKGFYQNFMCFLGYTKNYMKTYTQILPQHGIVRLNKEAKQIQVVCTTRWYIETGSNNLTGVLYQ